MGKELTIIIPTYNDSLDSIKASLDSINNQEDCNLSKLEIIIVDDCSTDLIYWNYIIRQYKNLDIKILFQKENKGPGIARQLGLDNSSGTYIFFLDCGDYIPDKKTINEFENDRKRNEDIIAFKIYDEEAKTDRVSFEFSNSFIFGIFIKKEFLEKNNIRFSNVLRWEEDSYFEELIRFYKPEVFSACKTGYLYKNNPNSITRKNEHEYGKEYLGYSAMVIKSILLCSFYKKEGSHSCAARELTNILSICYRKFYNDLFVNRKINERECKILDLLRILIEENASWINMDVVSKQLLIDIIKKNRYIFVYNQVPYEKIEEFFNIISRSENLFGNYDIDGTNISYNDLIRIKNKKDKKKLSRINELLHKRYSSIRR